eukprot:GFKZ01002572.1.p1 GENE.GFKZ01002572.1~~GFKZ01002572.1.p1  ORF type:complete len:297 (+),score=64.33 GFKZ01002572.1:193-1083(+)
MFRKKKALGSVTVFEDEPDNFDDLGLSSGRSTQNPATSDQPLDQMTSQQLEDLALSSANAGKDATARALQMATEAREIGVNTASAMKKQTEQLEKMGDDIEVVHDYLDKSERIIDKMSKPKLVRMFQRKKGTGKGLDKVKASRKDQDERDELRKKGLETLDLESFDGGSKGHISLQDLERDELLETGGSEDPAASSDGKRRIWKGRRGKGGGDVRVDAKNVREDYSGYSAGVADVMRKQDDDLDLISDALKDMRELAGAMNNELEYQDRLISEVQDFTVETSVRTKENARKIHKIK